MPHPVHCRVVHCRVVLCLVVLCLVLVLTACGKPPGGGGQPATFALRVAPAGGDAFLGARALVEVTLTRAEGFADEVEVGLEAPPEGVRSSTVVFPEGVTTTRLALSVNAPVEAGDVLALTVRGVGGAHEATAALRLTVRAPAPTSQELIGDALDAGAIDYGTSLLYRAYALFGDPELPEAFAGSGSEEEDNGLFVEIAEADATLDAATRAKLEPFVVRPADPGSVFNRERPSGAGRLAAQNGSSLCRDQTVLTWVSKESATTPVRVWMRCGSGDGTPPEAYIDRTLAVVERAYGPMTALMGEPILDRGGPDDGGDPNIDIYLSPYVVRGGRERLVWGTAGAHTVPAPPFGTRTSSGFIQLPEWRVFTSDFRPFLLHEFFHLLQNAHNRTIAFQRNAGDPNRWDEFWFVEASATWASIHFDRTLWGSERSTGAELSRFVYDFQNELRSLHVSEPALHMYAAYVWPFFVEQETDGPAFMGAIWRGLESATSFEGGNNVIDNVFDFEDNFHHFAVRNLADYDEFGDAFPARKRYPTLDRLFPQGTSALPAYRTDTILTQPAHTLPVSFRLPALGADYRRFVVGSPEIRKVEFDFSGLERAHLDIDALIDYRNGGWKLQTVTEDELTLCFDDPAEEADDIWLVLSNHAKTPAEVIADGFAVQTYPLCEDSWAGSSSAIISDAFPTYEISASVTWTYDDVLSVPEAGEYVYASGGTVSFRDVSGSGCTISPSSRPISGGSGDTLADGYLTVDYSTDPPRYHGAAATVWSATYSCPDFGSFTAGAGGAWFQAEGTLEPDGATIQGPQTNSGQTFTFRFTRREP